MELTAPIMQINPGNSPWRWAGCAVEEFTGRERRRYARKLLDLHERPSGGRGGAAAGRGRATHRLRQNLRRGAGREEESRPGCSAWPARRGQPEWVRDHFPVSMQTRLMAKVDEINKMGDHVGNVFSRRGAPRRP